MSRSLQLFALLGATVWMSSGLAKAGETKTPLIQDAVVHGSSIYLADLLPESSPSSLSVSAQKVLLGGSPQPGSIRVFSSTEIKQLLDGDENLLTQLDVPDQIAIRRLGRLITREEVVEAIRRSDNEALRNVQITPDRIRLSARVLIATTEDAQLRVTRIESDRMLHQMKFWLVSAADPNLLPFIAMATIPSSLHSDLVSEASTSPKGGSSDLVLGRTARPARALIESGQEVRLHLVSGAGIQMYLTAISLERGTLGQTIRVKIQSTGKILHAHVMGPAQLEAEL